MAAISISAGNLIIDKDNMTFQFMILINLRSPNASYLFRVVRTQGTQRLGFSKQNSRIENSIYLSTHTSPISIIR